MATESWKFSFEKLYFIETTFALVAELVDALS
jgi:hypothetical protein